jgi:succinyl-diaminopimelate desuccinylase
MSTTLIELVKKLVTFKTTHKNYKEIDACYAFISEYIQDRVKQEIIVEKITGKDGYSYIFHTANSLREFDILLSGHIDVVPGHEDLFAPKEEEGLLIGRGVADMKGTDATMILSFIELVNSFPDKKIALSLTMDEEEGDSVGMGQLIKEGLKSELVFIPDSADRSENWAITLEQKGYYTCDVHISGVSAHGASPWLGSNAITATADLICEIQEEFTQRYGKAHENNPWCPTINIGTISGGNVSNQVPDSCSFSIDFRFNYKFHVQEFKALVKSCIKEVQIDAVLVDRFEGESTWIGKNNDLIEDLVYQLEKKKIKYSFEQENGASEARFFSGLHNTVMLMPLCGGSHEAYEWLNTDSLEQYYEVTLSYFQAFLK